MAVFQPNLHSQYKISWVVVAPEVAESVRNLLTVAYDWPEVVAIKQVDESEQMSQNFRVRLVDDSNEREVLVRRHIAVGLGEAEQLEAINHLTPYLVGHQVPTPVIIPTLDGDLYYRHDNNLWQVFEFVSGDHFCGTEAELTAVAAGIAHLHRVLAEAPAVEQVDEERAKAYSRLAFSPQDLVTELKNFYETDDPLVQTAQTLIAGFGGWASQRQLIHQDLHPQNTLFQDGQLVAILDFANVGVGELASDVGMALHRFVRQYIVHRGKPWRETLPAGVKIFLDNYQFTNTLPKTTIKLLPAYMRSLLLQKIVGNAKMLKVGQRNETVAKAEFEKFSSLLEEVDLIAPLIN